MTIKKTISFLLALVMSLGVFGCSVAGDNDTKKAVVWTSASTTKILKESDYTARQSSKSVDISLFRNEYESAQIVITAGDSDIKEYTVTVPDLYCGNSKLEKESISLYHQKFIYLDSVKAETAKAGAGWYPDALLPLEKAVEYGENKIDAGCNQGVMLTVKTPKDQAAGTYTGNATVTVDGVKYSVPVSVTVWDYTLSDEVHSKSSFLLTWDEIAFGEYTDELSMQEKYYETLLEHRVNPNHLPGNAFQMYSVENAEVFVSYALKYAQDNRVTNYNIPYSRVTQVATTPVLTQDTNELVYEGSEVKTTSRNIETTDLVLFEKTLNMLFETSIEEQVDLFRAAGTYFIFFDEYELSDGYLERANYTLLSTARLYKAVAAKKTVELAKEKGLYDALSQGDKLIADGLVERATLPETAAAIYSQQNENYKNMVVSYYSGKQDEVDQMFTYYTEDEQRVLNDLKAGFTDFEKTVISNLENIRNKCVGPKQSILISKCMFVSTADVYDSMEAVNSYAEWTKKWYGEEYFEMWSYTCMNPKPPYPSYWIEDEVLSARAYGWMMYNYNITGNLYWDAALYQKAGGSGYVQDFYANPQRFPGYNGDGFLLYPGKEYGIEGPVSSIRLNAIRDGNEEYDLLYALEQEYRKIIEKKGSEYNGEGFENIQSLIVDELYRGTTMDYDNPDCYDKFAYSRSALATLILMAQSGVIVENYFVSEGEGKLTLSVDGDAVVKLNDTALTGGVSSNGVTTYQKEITLDKAENIISLTVEKEGKSYSVTFNAGEKLTVKDISLITDITLSNEGTSEIGTVESTTCLVLNFLEGAKAPQATMTVTALNITESAKTIMLKIHADKEVKIKVLGRAQNAQAYSTAETATLKAGWNEIEVDAVTFNCESYGNLKNLRISVESEIEGGATLAIGSVTVEG